MTKYGAIFESIIATGLWIDTNKQIHLEVDLFLKSHGFPVNDQTRQKLIDEMTACHREHAKAGMIVHTFDADPVPK